MDTPSAVTAELLLRVTVRSGLPVFPPCYTRGLIAMAGGTPQFAMPEGLTLLGPQCTCDWGEEGCSTQCTVESIEAVVVTCEFCKGKGGWPPGHGESEPRTCATCLGTGKRLAPRST